MYVKDYLSACCITDGNGSDREPAAGEKQAGSHRAERQDAGSAAFGLTDTEQQRVLTIATMNRWKIVN